MKKWQIISIALLAFLIGVLVQTKFGLLGNSRTANFMDFPQTRRSETGLYSGFDLNSRQFVTLVNRKSLTVNNRIYKLIATQYLNDDVVGYRVEINDAEKVGQPDIFPLGEGLIIYNTKSGCAIQLYNNMIWLRAFNDYTMGLSNTSLLEDLNKDGLQEFAVGTTTGGNSIAASNIYIFQITNDENYKLLNPDLGSNPNLNVSGIADIKQDGQYELIVTDNDWEISSCTDHANGPIIDLIYSWDSQKGYIDNSISYSEHYQKIIDTDISKQCSGTKDFCFGPALNQYFAYKQMGKEKEGWTKFLRLTDGVINSSWPSRTCRDYVINQHNQGKEITNPGQSIKI